MLQFEEKLWPVQLMYYPSEPATKLGEGWSLFVEENKLQAGDVCVFVLANKEDVVLDVHIFRGRSQATNWEMLLPQLCKDLLLTYQCNR